jgi:Mce-associated membrane protein
MLLTANDLVEAVEKSKVSTKAAVHAVAVESMTADSAVVLVAAKAEVTNPDKSKPPPRSWRIVMNLQRDGGQLKMSRVEFLP